MSAAEWTGLYTHSAETIALAHHRKDGRTMLTWTGPAHRAAAADILLYRHLLGEEPNVRYIQLPGRHDQPVLRDEANAWNDGTPSGLRQIARLDRTELTLQYRGLTAAMQRYTGLPGTTARSVTEGVTEILAHQDGVIRLARRGPDLVTTTELAGRDSTAVAQAVTFQAAEESSDPVDRVARTQFDAAHEDWRVIATVDDRAVRIMLKELWPVDRQRLNLLHVTD